MDVLTRLVFLWFLCWLPFGFTLPFVVGLPCCFPLVLLWLCLSLDLVSRWFAGGLPFALHCVLLWSVLYGLAGLLALFCFLFVCCSFGFGVGFPYSL